MVTGSSRGIGRAIAIDFAKEGAKVAVTYKIEKGKAQAVADEIRAAGSEAGVYMVALDDRAAVRKAVDDIKSDFGGLDILVNNAGINKPQDFDKITGAEWDEVIGVNLTGAFNMTQEALPVIKKGGSIINISSVSGQYGGPRTTHYCVTKAGIIAFTQNLAIFCAPRGIRVNAVSPGLIESEMAGAAKGLGVAEKILLKRMGTPHEVAMAAVFLASDDSSYITGHTLNVNGGLYLG